MVISSRRSKNIVIIECDGAEYHHRVIDGFRDDELMELCNLPIAHVYGKEIASSAERCALFIVERWFPEHMDTIGYSSALKIAYNDDLNSHVDGCSGFFPIGYVYPDDFSPSYTDKKIRALVRYITGDNDDHIFDNEHDKELFSAIKNELKQHRLVNRNLSHQELARACMIVCYDEPTRSIELEKLDNFLKRLSKINANSSNTISG
jgi:hypothetical protein